MKQRFNMVPRTLLYFVLSLMTLLPMAQANGDEGVAMITDLSGKGSIERQGKSLSGEILAYLMPGDTVESKAGSKLTLVYFASSAEYSFSGPVRVRIDSDKPSVIKGSGAQPRQLALAGDSSLGQVVSQNYSQAAIVMRSAAKKPRLNLTAPKNSNVLSTRPTFSWKPFGKGSEYRFSLSDELGKVVVQTTTDKTSYRPDNALQRDLYYSWRVEARQPSGETHSSSADFVVLSQEESARVEAVRPGSSATFGERVLFAALLEQMGAAGEAQQLWRELAKERPGNAVLQRKAKH